MSYLDIYSTSERNLEVFPGEQLNQLVMAIDEILPEGEGIGTRMQEYLNSTDYYKKLGMIDSKEAALAGHAICRYLQYCLGNNMAWAALFLFAPAIDPRHESVYDGNQSYPALEYFSATHQQQAMRALSEILIKVTSEPALVWITGPMYSFKSGKLKLVHQTLVNILGQTNSRPYIFGQMGEGAIHARSLPGENIAAKPLNIDNIIAEVEQILSYQNGHTPHKVDRIVLIEEATFFGINDQLEEDPELARRFAEQIVRLVRAGLSVVLSGLNTNYLTNNLQLVDIVNELMEAAELPIKTESCTSFLIHKYMYGDAMHQQVSKAPYTSRYNLRMGGMFDWYLPVLYPREFGPEPNLAYSPATIDHPMAILRGVDPELFEQICHISRIDFKEYLVNERQARLAGQELS